VPFLGYVNLVYKPSRNDLLCSFYVEPSAGLSIAQAAEQIAAESSIGTWTEISTMSKRIRKLGAKVFEIKNNFVKIAYPEELFEKGNIPQILSSVAGNIFGMKAVRNLRLLDIEFPEGIAKSFKGSEFGLDIWEAATRNNIQTKAWPHPKGDGETSVCSLFKWN
jgi:ribulose-bisphosphate carboxylase large chain